MFNAPVFTTAGKALLTRNISGEQIKFTTVQMGSGYISGSIDAMTALHDRSEADTFRGPSTQ